MTSTAPASAPARTARPLRSVDGGSSAAGGPAGAVAAVVPRTSATDFSECVRTVVTVARRRGLRPPAFRSPPRLAGVDRSIQRRRNGTVTVAVRRGERPFAAIQADVIEGVVAANRLAGEPADRFRRAAWSALEGASTPPAPAPAGPTEAAGRRTVAAHVSRVA